MKKTEVYCVGSITGTLNGYDWVDLELPYGVEQMGIVFRAMLKEAACSLFLLVIE